MTSSAKPLITGIPSNGIELLYSNNTQTVPSSSTSLVTHATYTLPAGIMGKNDSLRMEFLATKTGVTSTWQAQVTFGGQLVINENPLGASNDNWQAFNDMHNNNSLSSQKCFHPTLMPTPYSPTGTDIFTFAVDTTVDVDILFRMLVANAADAVQFEAMKVWLMRGTV